MRNLALLVGEGDLARCAADLAKQNTSDNVVILSMTKPFEGADDVVDVADPSSLVSCLHQHEATHLCAVGAVDLNAKKRLQIAAYLQKNVGGALDLSDLGIEQAYKAIADTANVKLLGVHEIAPQLLAGIGQIAGPAITFSTSEMKKLIENARLVASTDLGQSMIFSGARPIAAEDVLGTDSLLNRTAQIVASHRLGGTNLTLVKVAKPQQSGVGDLPTIGPETLERCAQANIQTILVEGQRCLIAQRDNCKKRAENLKISVFGWG